MLIEFGSVVGAVECSLALQKIAAERNVVIAGDRRMEGRIEVLEKVLDSEAPGWRMRAGE